MIISNWIYISSYVNVNYYGSIQYFDGFLGFQEEAWVNKFWLLKGIKANII